MSPSPASSAISSLRRKDIPFRRVFLLFGAFILACGTTHLMEAIIFWWPAYRLAGVIKLFTAIISWSTVIALVPVTPKALAMRSPEELEREIAGRKEAEAALHAANAELARQVEAPAGPAKSVSGCSSTAPRITPSSCSTRTAGWFHGILVPSASSSTVPRRSSVNIFHVSTRRGRSIREAGHELRVAAREGRYEEEGWRFRKDGSRFWANVVITALWDDQLKLRGFSKITRDMTVRKEAEENARRLLEEATARRAAEANAAAIWEERERLRVTLQSIGDGVIATDAEGRVTLLNPVAETLTGWSSREAAGQPRYQRISHYQ